MDIFEVRQGQITGNVDPILTRFAQGFGTPHGMVGPLACKDIPVNNWDITLRSYDKSIFVLYAAERALKALPKLIFSEMTSGTKSLAEHALGTNLDIEREINVAKRLGNGAGIDLEKKALNLINLPLMLEKEYTKASMVLGADYYAATNKTTLSGTSKWSDKVNSTPIADINTGLDTARSYMGVFPNTITMGMAAWKAFSEHPTVLATLPNTSAAIFGIEDFIRLFRARGVTKLVIGQSIYSVAPDSTTFTDIWTDNCAMTYVPVDSELDYAEGLPLHDACFNLKGYPKVYVGNTNPILRSYYQSVAYLVTMLSNTKGYLIIDCV